VIEIIDTACATMGEAIAELTRLRAEVAALKEVIEDLKFNVETANADARECEAKRDEARRALEKIAGGFINSDFVMEDPPNWHSAFSQLQKIAHAALSLPQEKADG
jgi:chromosome segregation ATPase